MESPTHNHSGMFAAKNLAEKLRAIQNSILMCILGAGFLGGFMAISVQGLAPLLQVFDMPASVRFYRDVLGFELVNQSSPGERFHWCMLRMNDAMLMLNTAYDDGQQPSTPDPTRVAAHADTILYFGCPDVDHTYRELCAKGLDLKEPKDAPYGMRQLYLPDPDGYKLCFQWPV